MDQAERSAVLVVRLWREAGAAAGGVRGRITTTTADETRATETAVAGAEEILELVRDWLDEFEST
jgi:hypothetical protein